MVEGSLIEELAAVQHEIWAHWMRYQFSICPTNSDGSKTIPADKVERWQRQIDTCYWDLTAKEQASDVEQAEKVMKVVEHVTV